MATILMATADLQDLSQITAAGTTLSTTRARTEIAAGTMPPKPDTLPREHKSLFDYRYSDIGSRYMPRYKNYASRNSTNVHVTVYFNPMTKFVSAYYRSTTTYYGGAIVPEFGYDSWQVFEVKLVIADGTSGSVVVKVNGVERVNVTGIDTNYSGGVCDNILMQSDSNAPIYLDDILIDDANWPGLGGIEVLAPTGNGNYTAWTNDYTAVDDNPPNDDTDYIYTDAETADTKETFTFADLAEGAHDPRTVGLATRCRLDGAGSGTVKPMIRSNGIDDIPDGTILTTSYVNIRRYWDTDPGNSDNPWSVAAVNALEAGVSS